MNIETGWIDNKNFNEQQLQPLLTSTTRPGFTKYMHKEGTLSDEKWKLFINWIIDYEYAAMMINPQPVEQIPAPLFTEKFFANDPFTDMHTFDEMVVKLLQDNDDDIVLISDGEEGKKFF